jgi:hypothetical protein
MRPIIVAGGFDRESARDAGISCHRVFTPLTQHAIRTAQCGVSSSAVGGVGERGGMEGRRGGQENRLARGLMIAAAVVACAGAAAPAAADVSACGGQWSVVPSGDHLQQSGEIDSLNSAVTLSSIDQCPSCQPPVRQLPGRSR